MWECLDQVIRKDRTLSVSGWLRSLVVAIVAVAAGPALAGDWAAGERLWRQCSSCHSIVAPTGEVIQRGGRTGPNLYGIADGPAASAPGFVYSPELEAARDIGLIWTEAAFIDYVNNPTAFMRRFLDNPGIRSTMGFQMRGGADDMFAYLEHVARH